MGSAGVTTGNAHLLQRAPMPGVAFHSQERCAQRFVFRILRYARSQPLPTLEPRSLSPPALRRSTARPQRGPGVLSRCLGKAVPALSEDPSRSLPPRGRVGEPSAFSRRGTTERASPRGAVAVPSLPRHSTASGEAEGAEAGRVREAPAGGPPLRAGSSAARTAEGRGGAAARSPARRPWRPPPF